MTTYARDIKPLFRPKDIACMDAAGVKLGDQQWMCDPGHAAQVYAALSAGKMPPDGAWPPAQVTLFKAWMDEGCSP